jgi:hypothetical protein
MNKIKNAARFIFSRAQKILLPAGLFFAYIFGVGLMALISRFSAVFTRETDTAKDTFWKPAEGYSADIPDAGEQS